MSEASECLFHDAFAMLRLRQIGMDRQGSMSAGLNLGRDLLDHVFLNAG